MFVPADTVRLSHADLLVFASPEPRCTYAATSLGANVRRLWIVDFQEYAVSHSRLSETDLHVRDEYAKNFEHLRRIGERLPGGVATLPAVLNYLQPFAELATRHTIGTDGVALVVDISTAPPGHLFALLAFARQLQISHGTRVLVAYVQVESHSPSEDAFSYGMQDVAVVPGFEGKIRIARDVLLLVLGFEGNRAYSLYRRLAPARTELIVGDSYDDQRDFYIATSRRNNHSLLHIHGNKATLMSSRDVDLFAQQVGAKLDELAQDREQNIYFSCLGTKAQVLGAYLALRSRPHVQVLDALPTRRRFGSGRPVSLLLDDFGVDRLATT